MAWEHVGAKRAPIAVAAVGAVIAAGVLLSVGDGGRSGVEAGDVAENEAALRVEEREVPGADANADRPEGEAGGGEAGAAGTVGGTERGEDSLAERGAIGPHGQLGRTADRLVSDRVERATPLPGASDLRLYTAREREIVSVDLATGQVRARDLADLGFGVRLGVGPVALVAVDDGVVAGRSDEEAQWLAPDLEERHGLGVAGAPVAADAAGVWLDQHRSDARRLVRVNPSDPGEARVELTFPAYTIPLGVVDGRLLIAVGGGIHAVEPATGDTIEVSAGAPVGLAGEAVLALECANAGDCALVRRAPTGEATAEIAAPGAVRRLDAGTGGGGALSPDARYALLPTPGGGGRAPLELVDLDAGARLDVHEPLTPEALTWSPDGAWVIDAARGLALDLATREAVELRLDLGGPVVIGSVDS